MSNVIRMTPPQGLPLERITKEALAKAKDVFGKVELPTELAFPLGILLEYIEQGGETTTKALFNGNIMFFRGRLKQLPNLVIFWKISRILQNGKVYAAPTFVIGRRGPNPTLEGCGSNLLELLGCDEKLVGDIGPLEEILPDSSGGLEELGIEFASKYDLQNRVEAIRRKLFRALQNLQK